MALSSYGVLSGRVVATHREAGQDTPHYQVHLVDDVNTMNVARDIVSVMQAA